MLKGAKMIPYLRIGNLKNHTLSRGTYLYSPYMGVPPRACSVVFCSIAFAISSSSISSFLFAPAPAVLFFSLFSFTRFCALLRAAALNFCSEYLSLHSRMSCRLKVFTACCHLFFHCFDVPTVSTNVT